MTMLSALMTVLSAGPSPLQATTAADRAAALEARKRELGAVLEKHKAEIAELTGRAYREHTAGVEAAEAEIEARRLELSASIATEWYEGAEPLLARWFDEPTRATSEKLRELLLRVAARAETELGAPAIGGIVLDACAPAFLTRFPGSCNLFGDDLGGVNGGILDKAERVFKSAPLGPVAFQRDLEALEEAVEREAATANARVPAPERLARYRARRAMVTQADRTARTAAFDAEQRAAELAASVASYVPPKNLYRLGS